MKPPDINATPQREWRPPTLLGLSILLNTANTTTEGKKDDLDLKTKIQKKEREMINRLTVQAPVQMQKLDEPRQQAFSTNH